MHIPLHNYIHYLIMDNKEAEKENIEKKTQLMDKGINEQKDIDYKVQLLFCISMYMSSWKYTVTILKSSYPHLILNQRV